MFTEIYFVVFGIFFQSENYLTDFIKCSPDSLMHTRHSGRKDIAHLVAPSNRCETLPNSLKMGVEELKILLPALTLQYMNQLLVEFQVKKLLFFFESHPRKEKTLIPQEYKNLIRGLVLLAANCPEEFSCSEPGEILNMKNVKDKHDLRKEFQKILREPKERISMEYSEICNILRAYWTLITQPQQKNLPGQEWLEIAGYLRDLELERLSVRKR